MNNNKMSIEEFSKETICNILDEFLESGSVFSNEKQFQFELARALADKTERKILFEPLCLDKANKKYYIDLAVAFDNNEYVCIELKYKSAEKPTTKKPPQGFNKDVV